MFSFSDIAIDWSDHALWWPQKNTWLTRTRSTLDQYGVSADAKLLFTPMHKNVMVQLPDLQALDMRVNFSINVFSAVIQICKELGKFHSILILGYSAWVSRLAFTCLVPEEVTDTLINSNCCLTNNYMYLDLGWSIRLVQVGSHLTISEGFNIHQDKC